MLICFHTYNNRHRHKRHHMEHSSNNQHHMRAPFKRVRPQEEVEGENCSQDYPYNSCGSTKPRLPSCLVGATPEIMSTDLRGGYPRSHGGSSTSSSNQLVKETDPHRLSQRQKQIDYGKNTLGYDRYTQLLPKSARRRTDPQTPDINAKMSTKRFNGLVRAWRRRLHEYDPVSAPHEAEGSEGTGPSGVTTMAPSVAALFSPSAATTTGSDTKAQRPMTAPYSYAAAVRTPASNTKTDRDDASGDDEEYYGQEEEEEDGHYEMRSHQQVEKQHEAEFPNLEQHVHKKSRVNPYMDEEDEENYHMATGAYRSSPSLAGHEKGAEDTDMEEEGDYEITPAPAQASAMEDEDLCYSDDDLL